MAATLFRFPPLQVQVQAQPLWTNQNMEDELQSDFSLFYNHPDIVSSAQQEGEVSVQDTDSAQKSEGGVLLKGIEPARHSEGGFLLQGTDSAQQSEGEILLQDTDSVQQSEGDRGSADDGLVRIGIKSAQVVLERWLTEAPHVRIIGVCGVGSVGKTNLLQKAYNIHKVSYIFDVVIWVTVGHSSIDEFQGYIARAINLDLSIYHSNVNMRKMKLSGYLKTKKFLLILDDIRYPPDLKELGVEFGCNQGSKVVFSTRDRRLIRLIKPEKSMLIQTLSTEEAWELFCSVAFKDGHVPLDVEHSAREVAGECGGLPLTIKIIASTMIDNTAVHDWNRALKQMQTRFPISHAPLDNDLHELYRILRWSYDSLPDDNLKNCFMYCAMFPRDEEIEVDKLVGMWIAEGLVNSVDAAHSYIRLFVDRRLLQVTHIPHGIVFLKTHNTLRDMAIYIGQEEDADCLFWAGFRHAHFPDSKHFPQNWEHFKRIIRLESASKGIEMYKTCEFNIRGQ